MNYRLRDVFIWFVAAALGIGVYFMFRAICSWKSLCRSPKR